MLILSRKTDQKIKIGDDISLTIIEIQGEQVRVGIEAPKSVKVFRQEIYNAIQEENRKAAESSSESLSKLESLLG